MLRTVMIKNAEGGEMGELLSKKMFTESVGEADENISGGMRKLLDIFLKAMKTNFGIKLKVTFVLEILYCKEKYPNTKGMRQIIELIEIISKQTNHLCTYSYRLKRTIKMYRGKL